MAPVGFFVFPKFSLYKVPEEKEVKYVLHFTWTNND